MDMSSRTCSRAFVVGFLLTVALRPLPAKDAESSSPPTAAIEQLWVNPSNLKSRDLFYGPGGRELVPASDVEYRFKSTDKTGHSAGYEVTDPRDREWKIKIGDEVQSEIAVSRILWAIGYHQPVMHYVPQWKMTGGPEVKPEPGRFRFESDHKKEGNWSWEENPFVGSQPFRGLVVVNLLLNNWDLEPDNNRIYEVENAKRAPKRQYVVQDLGGSLGKTRWPVGGRNDIDGFESQAFVKSVDHGGLDFDYHGPHQALVKSLTRADVLWACRLVSRLSDRQLTDAFRAAGYKTDSVSRYVRKIRQKLAEGLALDTRAAGSR
jgi:hypothetical protein